MLKKIVASTGTTSINSAGTARETHAIAQFGRQIVFHDEILSDFNCWSKGSYSFSAFIKGDFGAVRLYIGIDRKRRFDPTVELVWWHPNDPFVPASLEDSFDEIKFSSTGIMFKHKPIIIKDWAEHHFQVVANKLLNNGIKVGVFIYEGDAEAPSAKLRSLFTT